MQHKLAALVDQGVSQFLVDAYLDDPKRGENRIFEHTNLNHKSHQLFKLKKKVADKIEVLKDGMLKN